MLVVREGADPEGRRKRQAVCPRMEVEHRDRLREGRAPSVTYEPLGPLRLCCGDEVNEAAEVREREREDEVVMDVVPG